jgi:hypothetical protein
MEIRVKESGFGWDNDSILYTILHYYKFDGGGVVGLLGPVVGVFAPDGP